MSVVELMMERRRVHLSSEALDLTTENPFEEVLGLAEKVKVQPMQVMWRAQFHPFRASRHE